MCASLLAGFVGAVEVEDHALPVVHGPQFSVCSCQLLVVSCQLFVVRSALSVVSFWLVLVDVHCR